MSPKKQRDRSIMSRLLRRDHFDRLRCGALVGVSRLPPKRWILSFFKPLRETGSDACVARTRSSIWSIGWG